MGMSNRQKGSLVILAMGVAAVAVDRLVILPGPASAAAEAALGQVAPEIDLEAIDRLSRQLLEQSAPGESILLTRSSEQIELVDAFASLFPEAQSESEPGQPKAESEAAEQPQRTRAAPMPVLSAIVLTGSGGYAVLDGHPLGVGATRDGWTLRRLTGQTATIERDGVIYTLSLHD